MEAFEWVARSIEGDLCHPGEGEKDLPTRLACRTMICTDRQCWYWVAWYPLVPAMNVDRGRTEVRERERDENVRGASIAMEAAEASDE